MERGLPGEINKWTFEEREAQNSFDCVRTRKLYRLSKGVLGILNFKYSNSSNNFYNIAPTVGFIENLRHQLIVRAIFLFPIVDPFLRRSDGRKWFRIDDGSIRSRDEDDKNRHCTLSQLVDASKPRQLGHRLISTQHQRQWSSFALHGSQWRFRILPQWRRHLQFPWSRMAGSVEWNRWKVARTPTLQPVQLSHLLRWVDYIDPKINKVLKTCYAIFSLKVRCLIIFGKQ